MLCEMCMWKLMAEQSEYDVISCCIFLLVHIQLLFCISERMETVLRFKVYELRALYQVQVLIIYIYLSGPYNVNNLSLGQLFEILM